MAGVVRKYGPVLLVPLAWTLVTGAHFYDTIGRHELFMAHIFMTLIMFAFVAVSWNEMNEEVLLIWKKVIALGVPATFAGALGLTIFLQNEPLQLVSIFYWMVSPGIGLYVTGRATDLFSRPYRLTGFASVIGALIYSIQFFTQVPALLLVMYSMLMVGSAQTLGILLAAYQNSLRDLELPKSDNMEFSIE